MNSGVTHPSDVDSRLSQIRMAILYGIEGLEQSRGGIFNDWLELFGLALDNIENPKPSRSGHFPLLDEDSPVDIEDLTDNLDFLDRKAREIKENESCEGHDVSEYIEIAEEIYDVLEEVDEETSDQMLM